jgi:hypothetical protein
VMGRSLFGDNCCVQILVSLLLVHTNDQCMFQPRSTKLLSLNLSLCSSSPLGKFGRVEGGGRFGREVTDHYFEK